MTTPATRALTLAVLSTACAPARPAGLQFETHLGAGWAVTVPAGARVESAAFSPPEAAPNRLTVSSPDGMWWFDIEVVPKAASPLLPATTFAERDCRPIRWDAPAELQPGLWTGGGVCTIGERRYWLLISVEDEGDQSVITGLFWAIGHRGYEDTWVAWTQSALSLSEGTTPQPLVETADLVRQTLRAIPPDDGTASQLPLPGGGVYSAKLERAFADAWATRAERTLPHRFPPSP
jgi:hypothetical protein